MLQQEVLTLKTRTVTRQRQDPSIDFEVSRTRNKTILEDYLPENMEYNQWTQSLVTSSEERKFKQKMCKNYITIIFISRPSKGMLRVLLNISQEKNFLKTRLRIFLYIREPGIFFYEKGTGTQKKRNDKHKKFSKNFIIQYYRAPTHN